MKRVWTKVAVGAVALVGLSPAVAAAQPDRDAPVTPATAIHGLPGNNPAFSDEDRGACPADVDGCDGGLHNIAGVRARQGRNGGTPPACTAHGGLGTVNDNC